MRGEPDRLLVTLRTFSKIYGLAGLRIGYGVATGGGHRRARAASASRSTSTALAQVAALAALDDDEHVERTPPYEPRGHGVPERRVRAARSRVRAELGELHPRARRRRAAVYEALLRHGVIVRPMAGYGFPEHVRVTVGTAEENRRFVDALEKALG